MIKKVLTAVLLSVILAGICFVTVQRTEAEQLLDRFTGNGQYRQSLSVEIDSSAGEQALLWDGSVVVLSKHRVQLLDNKNAVIGEWTLPVFAPRAVTGKDKMLLYEPGGFFVGVFEHDALASQWQSSGRIIQACMDESGVTLITEEKAYAAKLQRLGFDGRLIFERSYAADSPYLAVAFGKKLAVLSLASGAAHPVSQIEWLGVDGEPIADRQTLRRLYQRADAGSQGVLFSGASGAEIWSSEQGPVRDIPTVLIQSAVSSAGFELLGREADRYQRISISGKNHELGSLELQGSASYIAAAGDTTALYMRQSVEIYKKSQMIQKISTDEDHGRVSFDGEKRLLIVQGDTAQLWTK